MPFYEFVNGIYRKHPAVCDGIIFIGVWYLMVRVVEYAVTDPNVAFGLGGATVILLHPVVHRLFGWLKRDTEMVA